MSAQPTGWVSGLLLIVIGVWVVLQTIVGNLAGRILKLGTGTSSAPSPVLPGTGTPAGSNPASPSYTGPAGQGNQLTPNSAGGGLKSA